jgi:chemotaxis protein MotB
MIRFRLWTISAAVLLVPIVSGCGGKKELLVQKDQEITRLTGEVNRLQSEVKEEREKTDQLEDDLKNVLADLEETEQVCLEETEGCQRITMSDAATFASGSTALTSQGKKIIDTIWGVLDEYPDRRILIEGHTDNVPIAPKFRDRFRSNWDLSTARALAVLHYIMQTKKTDPGRISIIGYGEHQPIADNSTEEGRSKNRRVVITIRDRWE